MRVAHKHRQSLDTLVMRITIITFNAASKKEKENKKKRAHTHDAHELTATD